MHENVKQIPKIKFKTDFDKLRRKGKNKLNTFEYFL